MKSEFLRPLPIALPVLLLALGGCASGPAEVAVRSPSLIERLTPYRIDIQQGNVVTREQLAVIKPGMSREQVRDVLGTPMLTDVFHEDRWDYLYASIRRTAATPTQRRLSVAIHFKGDGVDRIVAPELPTEHEFVAAMVDPKAPKPKLPVLQLTPEQKAKLPAPVKAEPAASVQPRGAARSYPPLESGQ